MKKRQLIGKLKDLTAQGFIINYKFNVGDKYGYNIIGNNTIEVVLKNIKWINGGKTTISIKTLNKIFKNILKELNTEIVMPVITKELGYEQSLEWLYIHYPYGGTNGSNVILIDGLGRIVAVNYTNSINFSTIYSKGITIKKDYIVLNNSKKLKGEWQYNEENKNKLKGICEYLFFNKKTNNV